MKHYATTYRPHDEETRATVSFVSRSPVTNAILASVGGCSVILDRHRQIVGATDGFLRISGVGDAGEVTGRRVGEALGCVHCAGGCGASEWCSTCGVAIAVVSAQVRTEPVSRRAVMRRLVDGRALDSRFQSTCMPIRGEGPVLLLVRLSPVDDQIAVPADDPFWDRMQDHTRTMVWLSRWILERDGADPIARLLHETLQGLEHEMRARMILLRGTTSVDSHEETFHAADLLESLRVEMESAPEASGRSLDIRRCDPSLRIRSVRSLVHVLLRCLLLNALEASVPGETVQLELEAGDGGASFLVANPAYILPHFALRIFQRHFTTREGNGRGQGTWMARRIGEEMLGGRVWFTSDPREGTRFHLDLPPRALVDRDAATGEGR